MKLIKKYKPYGFELTVYLSSWFPLFGQGWFVGFHTAFVRFVYYKNTKVICWEDPSNNSTNDVIRHEYGHLVSRKQGGFFNFWINIIWDYIRFWIPHNLKLMEIEANDIKLGLK